MIVAPFIFIIVTAAAAAVWLWRESDQETRLAYALYFVAGWSGLNAAVAWGFSEAAWTPRWLVIAYLFLWSAVFWALKIDWRMWILPPAGAFALFGLLWPEGILPLLSWGLITFLPTAVVLQNRRDTFGLPLMPRQGGRLQANRSPRLVGKMDQEQLESQRPILECLNSGVVVSNRNGDIQFVNHVAAKLIGESADDIVGQPVMSVLSRLPMLSGGTPAEDKDQKQTRFEMNGRLIEGSMSIVYNKQGHMQGTVAVMSDITDAYQSQRAKTAFLTTVSHELRTPLTAIKGYVEMLNSDVAGELNSNQKMFLGTIGRNVSRMVQLINSLIFVSAVRGGRLETQREYTNLRQITEQTTRELQEMAERNKQIIHTEVDPQIKPIQADSMHVSTMLHELISNSIKYNEPGGNIYVRARQETGERPEDEFVVVQVADDGIGIDPSDQIHIFDDFYRPDTSETQVKAGGMGVGLSIVRALVEAYNGRIWLDSTPGEGSTFTFVLPVSQSENAIAEISE